MKIIPTNEGVENVQKLQGRKWHGRWQQRLSENIINNNKVINQCMRQAGKGYALTEDADTALTGGLIVTIGMPTLTQSQRILFRSIADGMAVLERRLNRRLRRIVDQTTEIIWNNGAELRALSSNEASQKEGYTSDWVIIDEAHNAEPSILKIFSAFTNQAKRYGRDKLILNGIGGHPESVIEKAKTYPGFSSLRITPEDVAHDDPTYIPIIEDARATLSPEEFRQHYDCLPVMEGMRYVFPFVNEELPLPDFGLTSTFYFGIDVGRLRDATFVCVIEVRGGVANIVDELVITSPDFIIQGGLIFKFIDKYPWTPKNIAIEVNGMGYGLYDILNHGPFYGLIPFTCTDTLAVSLTLYIQKLMRKRLIGIRAPQMFDAFKKLTYEVKPNGKYVYEHSDPFASARTGFTLASREVAA